MTVIHYSDHIVKYAVADHDPEPATLLLTAGDDEWSWWLSLTPSRGRSHVRMWPVLYQ